MKNIYFFFVLIFMIAGSNTFAQRASNVSVKDYRIEKNGSRLDVNLALAFDGINISSKEQLIVQPVILVNATDTIKLPYILFVGKTREKVNERKVALNGSDGINWGSYDDVRVVRGDRGVVEYNHSIPFENRFYGAQVQLIQDVYGCADCHKELAAIPVTRISGQPRVAYIMPVPVMEYEKSLSLYVQFPWDKSVIFDSFGNNAEELNKLELALDTVRHLPNARISSVALKGFASPEGTWEHNTNLAVNRAHAVEEYIEDKFPEDRSLLRIESEPEDWEGLRKSIDSLDIPNKNKILEVIDNEQSPDRREWVMRQIAGSETYHYLIRNIYPSLRRVDASIKYTIDSPFTPEQMREMVISQPDQLQLNDYYILGAIYPIESQDFKDVFHTAWNHYPEDDVISTNRAALALEKGDVTVARKCLEKEKDSAEALNNMGVLLFHEGRIDEAAEYFRKASEKGSKEAIHNLQYVVASK